MEEKKYKHNAGSILTILILGFALGLLVASMMILNGSK